ncbi:MAG: sugar phosphate isomerase/epimerase family protein [Planctomycetota bacterium]
MRTLSTVAPFGFDFEEDRYLAAYAALGCTGAQYYRNLEREPSVSDVLATCGRHGLRVDSMHGVFGPEIDPSSPNADHRAKCLERYRAEGELSLELGAPMVVVHPSAHLPAPPDDPFNFPEFAPEEAAARERTLWPHFDDFARRLADIGEQLGVTYIFENMGMVAPVGHNAAALAEHVASVGSERIRMCFDTGHAHFTGDMLAALRARPEAIAYLHLHDNDRVIDNHLLPGDGTIDWFDFGQAVRSLAIQAPCMIEVFVPIKKVEALDRVQYGRFLSMACALPPRAA